MVFITCNQCMGLLLFTKQTNFILFAMYSIIGKLKYHAIGTESDLVLQIKCSHVVMDDVFREQRNIR